MRLPVADANAWATTIVRALGTPWPWAAGHLATGPDDCDVDPYRLHPAFHGCLDWHSSVHMQWSAVVLLDAGVLDAAASTALTALLDERLTPSHGRVEAAYLAARPGFERPYGWGWLAALAAATAGSGQPHAPGWAAAVRPVADVVFGHVLAWLPRLAYPVRTGTHDNTALGLLLLHEAADALGRTDVVEAIASRARDWFGGDRDYPVAWEPSGHDFLSPALCEAVLMQRILPAADVVPWLAGFLPGLAAEDDPLLVPPRVLDATDGHLVHLHGLALSRAWHLRELAALLAPERAARARAGSAALVASAQAQVVAGDFMATHWLVSFALRAARAAS